MDSLEPLKAHPTGDFVMMAQNGGCMLIHLASGRDENSSLGIFFYNSICIFLLMLYLMLDEHITFCNGDF